MLTEKRDDANIGCGIFHTQTKGAGYAVWARLRRLDRLGGEFKNFQKFGQWYRRARWGGEFDQVCCMAVSGHLLSYDGIVSKETAMVIPRSMAMLLAIGEYEKAIQHFMRLIDEGKLSTSFSSPVVRHIS